MALPALLPSGGALWAAASRQHPAMAPARAVAGVARATGGRSFEPPVSSRAYEIRNGGAVALGKPGVGEPSAGPAVSGAARGTHTSSVAALGESGGGASAGDGPGAGGSGRAWATCGRLFERPVSSRAYESRNGSHSPRATCGLGTGVDLAGDGRVDDRMGDSDTADPRSDVVAPPRLGLQLGNGVRQLHRHRGMRQPEARLTPRDLWGKFQRPTSLAGSARVEGARVPRSVATTTDEIMHHGRWTFGTHGIYKAGYVTGGGGGPALAPAA